MVKASEINEISNLLYRRKTQRESLEKILAGLEELDNPEHEDLSALAAGRNLIVESFARRMFFEEPEAVRAILYAAQQGTETAIARLTARLATFGIEDDNADS